MPRRNYKQKPLKHQPFQPAGSNNCAGKKAFTSEYQAKQFCNELRRLYPDTNHKIYYCPSCQKYHLTSKNTDF